MKIIHGEAKYELRQQRLMEEIVRTIAEGLDGVPLKKSERKDLVADIASSVGAIIDGSAYVDFEDDYLVPVLTFAEGRMRDKLLAPKEGGSSLHEFCPGIVEDIFGSKRKNA